MAEATVDKVSIELGASSSEAANEIKKLAESMKSLKTAAKSAASGKEAATNMFKGMSADSVQAMAKIDLLRKKVSILQKELSSKMSMGKLNDKGIANAALQIKNIQQQIERTSQQATKQAAKEAAAKAKAEQKAAKDAARAAAAEQKAAQKAAKEAARQAAAEQKATERAAREAAKKAADEQKAAAKAAKEAAKIPIKFDPGKGGLSGMLGDMKQIGSELKSSIKPGMQAFTNMMKSAAKYAANLAKNFMSFAGKALTAPFKGIEKALSGVQKLLSSLGRIAFYRAIRSAIKYVTDALKEGAENAYWFSRQFGDATKYISEAYDRLSSSEFKMKNQLGAAWTTLIATIEPIIQKIISLVTQAANAITQLFALLSGKGTYMKAVDYNKQWADSATGAAKAAKEWKNQLMGFDEINRLEEPTGSSGGSGKEAEDYQNMFEETPVSKFFEDIKTAFKNGEWANLGRVMGEKVNEVVNSINWKDLGVKFGRGLQAIITTGYNFLKTVDFKNIGTKIGEYLNGALETVDFNQLGRLWMRLRTALWDVIYGAIISLDWALVAEKLSDFVLGALTELSEWLETLEPEEIAKALKDFFGNIKYDEIKEKFKEVLQQVLNITGDVIAELLPESLGDDVRDGIANAIKKADFAAIHNVLSYKLDEAVFGKKWADFWWSHGDYAGKEIVLGMINGNNAEAANWSDTMKTNVSDTVDNTFLACRQSVDEYNAGYSQFVGDVGGSNTTLKADMTGMQNSVTGNFTTLDGSASTTSASVCGSIMAMGASGTGFQNDISGMRDSVISDFWTLDSNISTSSFSISNSLERIKNAARAAWEWLSSLGDAGQMRIDAGGGIWNSMNYSGGYNVTYASGGFPEDGLFFANHNELVGGFSNGRTAVANNEMIVDGISRGVYNAVSSAMSQNNRGGSGVTVLNVNGREFMRAVWSDQQAVASEHGVSLIRA